ncbi:MAG: LysM domain-containing protein [Polyangia bacterium]
MRAWLSAAILSVLALGAPASAAAWIHVSRTGETLAQLASFYYGDESRSMVIRAANGFVHPDDGRLTPGERIEIPQVTYHRVEEGESWADIAKRYLGSARRGRFLAELNDAGIEDSLARGEIVTVPYQLLYILAPEESPRGVARMFLGKSRGGKWLEKYNLGRKKKYGRGDALLIPIIDLELTDEARERIDEARGREPRASEREAQRRAVERVAEMREAFAAGRYVEIVAIAQNLLGGGALTVPQRIGVYKYLAFAYVALGQRELAVEAFASALELQPAMELSPITTSPKIIEVFRRARDETAAER